MQKLGISNLHIYIPVFLSMLGTDELLHFSRKKSNAHSSWGCGQDHGRQLVSKPPNNYGVVL